MHIALVNSFPNQPHTAEIEFIARFKQAAERLGHSAVEVVTSDDIEAASPDFVLATHDFTPKLTAHLTLGTMWNPPHFFKSSPERLESILSYDGFLVGSNPIRKFLEELEASRRVFRPKSSFLFVPSGPSRPAALPIDRLWDLVYVGVHWDGSRHAGLLARLAESGLLNVYGPGESWAKYPGSYRGRVPFDGESVFQVLSKHGIALCLHKDEHRRSNTPSARLFEAAAAGCLLITDGLPFARQALGDCAFHVDLDRPGGAAATILAYVAWARAHPREAAAMASRSHDILESRHALEETVARTCQFAAFVEREAKARRSRAISALQGTQDTRGPLIDVLLHAEGASMEELNPVLRALEAQEGVSCRVLVFGSRRSFKERAGSPLTIESIDGFGSDVGAALGRVTAPYFALLGIHDRPMPDHFGSLLELAASCPGAGLFEADVVRVRSCAIARQNFHGPLATLIQERRQLASSALSDDPAGNAWLARSDQLDRFLENSAALVGTDRNLSDVLAITVVRSCRPTLHRVGSSEIEQTREYGRALVEERALSLRLRRELFDAEERIANVERIAAASAPPTASFEALSELVFKALGEVEVAAGSPGRRSRVSAVLGWISPDALSTRERIAAVVRRTRDRLTALLEPAAKGPADPPGRSDRLDPCFEIQQRRGRPR